MATAEQYAELDKEVRAELARLQAENVEKNAIITELRLQIAQMERDTPTLSALAQMIQRQKDQHAAIVTKLRADLDKAKENGSGR